MEITEITTKSALVRSGIPGVDYVINPYLGCGHGCRYCYAVFMLKHAHHHSGARWGTFVEAKVNIPEVLRDELSRKRKIGEAMLSSVCDPYQPAELRYKLTRRCVEALVERRWGIGILTRSPLVLRDVDLFQKAASITVGMSIPTDDDAVRRKAEPNSPPIGSRIVTLRKLKEAGIRTWAFIAPMLPMNPERLYEMLSPVVSEIMISALNYRGQVEWLYRAQGWEYALTNAYAKKTRGALKKLFGCRA